MDLTGKSHEVLEAGEDFKKYLSFAATEESNSLSTIQAHKLLEDHNRAKTAVEFKELIREIDMDSDGRVRAARGLLPACGALLGGLVCVSRLLPAAVCRVLVYVSTLCFAVRAVPLR